MNVGSLLQARYGGGFEGAAELGELEVASAAPILEGLLSHRSVRRFAQRELPPATLELLLGAAQSAASSSNLQLWSVVVVEDREKRRVLAEVAGGQAHVEESALFLVWIADLHRSEVLSRAHALESQALHYLEMFLMAAVDTALAAQNAVIAAEALGLGTVYIGALRNDVERVAELLSLPPRALPVFGLCVGWPEPSAAPAIKPRLPQAAIAHRDVYRSEAFEPRAIAAYDELMQRFYAEQRMPATAGGWSLHSAQRVGEVAALRGRDELRPALRRLGFELK